MSSPDIHYAVEGSTDFALAQRIIIHCGGKPGFGKIMRGKGRLDPGIPKLVEAARMQPWLIIRDLDNDAQCAGQLIANRKWHPEEAHYCCLRIAVRSVESWVMSDADGLSQFLRVSRASIPSDPERLAQPKRQLVDLARRSRSSAVREAMVPRERSGRSTGAEYESFLTNFISNDWNIEGALRNERAPSLNRAVRRMKDLIAGLSQ